MKYLLVPTDKGEENETTGNKGVTIYIIKYFTRKEKLIIL